MSGTPIQTMRRALLALQVFSLVAVLFIIAPEAVYSGAPVSHDLIHHQVEESFLYLLT
jgi:hypothetical protein